MAVKQKRGGVGRQRSSVPWASGMAAVGVLLATLAGVHRSGLVDRLGGTAASELPYLSTYSILRRYPHDRSSFVQGLCFDDRGNLFESAGHYGRSRVFEVNLDDGRPKREFSLPHQLFAEGLACLPGGKLLQLTWREGIVIKYDTLPELKVSRSYKLQPRVDQTYIEQWGIAQSPDGLLYTSDGSDQVTVRDKHLKEVRVVRVRDALLGRYVDGLNELEFVNGELWANVYPMYRHLASPCVARFDPATGRVKGWVYFGGLAAEQREAVRKDELNYPLNGLAANGSHVLVTGKEWDYFYSVELGSEASSLTGEALEVWERLKRSSGPERRDLVIAACHLE